MRWCGFPEREFCRRSADAADRGEEFHSFFSRSYIYLPIHYIREGASSFFRKTSFSLAAVGGLNQLFGSLIKSLVSRSTVYVYSPESKPLFIYTGRSRVHRVYKLHLHENLAESRENKSSDNFQNAEIQPRLALGGNLRARAQDALYPF